MFRSCLVLSLLGAVACGPPGLGPTGTGTGTDSETNSGTTTSTDDSTSTTTTTSEDTTGDDEWGMSFVPEHQEYIHGDPCDPFVQDCPEGEKCVGFASGGGYWNDNKCVPVTGSQAPGEPCSYGGPFDGTDNCDVDSACWDIQEIDGEWSGVCRPFCEGSYDDPECAEGTTCLIVGEGSLNFCVLSCDPLAQDCDEGYGCFWGGSAFVCRVTNGDVPVGGPCVYHNDCEAGLSCLDSEYVPTCDGPACCTPYCDVTLGDVQCEAAPGTSCVVFYEEPPPGAEDIGVCISA